MQRRLIQILCVITLVVGLFLFSLYNTRISYSAGLSNAKASNLNQEPELSPVAFLPLIFEPSIQTIFGMETFQYTNADTLGKAKSANATWLRLTPFHWDEIEPVRTDPPTYNWLGSPNFPVREEGIRMASERDFTLIAVIRNTPEWARLQADPPPPDCGPIDPVYLPEFRQFVRAVVEKYSVYPYNIKYWEIGNEPDVGWTATWPGDDAPFGCWGIPGDPYFGGMQYAAFLSAAYDEIKAFDPALKVLNGGLLLDCDPGLTPGSPEGCPIGSPYGAFLEGILKYEQQSQKQTFDILSFHGYPYWDNPNPPTPPPPTPTRTTLPYPLYGDEHHLKWDHRNGVVLGKIEFLREKMLQYGISRPILQTESSLLSYWTVADSRFLEDQATYVVWLYVRNWALNPPLLGSIWFTLEGPGWRHTGLLDNGIPRPAYYSYKFLSNELQGATFVGLLTPDYPVPPNPGDSLNGYEFRSPGKHIWVLWSPIQQDTLINLPANVLILPGDPPVPQIFDKYGNLITPSGNQLVVNDPIYIELIP